MQSVIIVQSSFNVLRLLAVSFFFKFILKTPNIIHLTSEHICAKNIIICTS